MSKKSKVKHQKFITKLKKAKAEYKKAVKAGKTIKWVTVLKKQLSN